MKAAGEIYLIFFLQTEDFRNTYQFNQFIIIQIDTDVCDSDLINVPKIREGRNSLMSEIYMDVKQKLIEIMGIDFYDSVKERTIFAIPFYTIEFWLLPILKKDMKYSNKFVNCLKDLNIELNKREGYTIKSKDPDVYNEISGPYRKNKHLLDSAKYNESLKYFIDDFNSFGVGC